MIEGAKQVLAFAEGHEDHSCVVHVPDEIDVKAIREKISLSLIQEGDLSSSRERLSTDSRKSVSGGLAH